MDVGIPDTTRAVIMVRDISAVREWIIKTKPPVIAGVFVLRACFADGRLKSG
jgi:hypothetical protein